MERLCYTGTQGMEPWVARCSGPGLARGPGSCGGAGATGGEVLTHRGNLPGAWSVAGREKALRDIPMRRHVCGRGLAPRQ